MSKRVIITVTRDAEAYFITNITGYTDPQSIRKRIFSQLRIPDNLHPTFALYRTELGALAIGDALDDSGLLAACRQFGDEIGSLKFIAQGISSPTPKADLPPATPLVVPTPPLQDPFPLVSNTPVPQSLVGTPVSANQSVHEPEPALTTYTAGAVTQPVQILPMVELHGADDSASSNTASPPTTPAGTKPSLNAPDVIPRKQQQITSDWVRGELIGRGTFGRVYLATRSTTGETMAVKQANLPQNEADRNDSRQTAVIEAMRVECDILRELDHPHIVQYLGSEETTNTFSMFMEYIDGGSLGSRLQEYGKLEDELARSFSYQVIDGLVYIHAAGILHCNEVTRCLLKSIVEDAYQNYQGTMMQGAIFWMAPEMLHNNNRGYNAKVDIWSMGCTILEMLSGQRPWTGEDTFSVMLKVGGNQEAPPIPDGIHLTSHAEDFRQKCLAGYVPPYLN
ncbi:hypothetical protein FRC10_009013 [Ceratobasidium sp. 414]|nr:hypothetical protein FRC10_009013 [Ceratobasidium sp. 414]